MVTLLLCNILWWRKDDGWRFELERGVNFLLGNQQCLLIRSDLVRSCHWNFTSLAKIWTLGLMLKIRPKRIVLGL